jgi:hypothetical protein
LRTEETNPIIALLFNQSCENEHTLAKFGHLGSLNNLSSQYLSYTYSGLKE